MTAQLGVSINTLPCSFIKYLKICVIGLIVFVNTKVSMRIRLSKERMWRGETAKRRGVEEEKTKSGRTADERKRGDKKRKEKSEGEK